jgi:hypothetical protein
MRGQGLVPDDFERFGAEEIEMLFEAEPGSLPSSAPVIVDEQPARK